MTPLNFDELESAYFWVSDGIPFENIACVSRKTGEIFWKTEESALPEEIPDDIDDYSLYIDVPNKNDLDLGSVLVFRFVDERFPDALDEVRVIFSKRGAYSRYKDLLENEGLLDSWYEFEREATERALREWARENGFELSAPRQTED